MLYTVSIILRKLIRDLIIVVVLSSLIVSFYKFNSSIHPDMVVDERTPQHTVLEYENITFNSTDDLVLKGWFIPAVNKVEDTLAPTVIVMHGTGLNKSHALDWSYYLADEYNLFLFDFRGHGASEGNKTTFGNKETKDLLGAIEYIKTRPDVDGNKLAVFGYEMGADVGIITATITSDIRLIIADSPHDRLTHKFDGLFEEYWILQKPLSWLAGLWSSVIIQTSPASVAPVDNIQYTTAPLFIMAGENSISGAGVQDIFDNSVAAGSEIWTVPGSHHSLFFSHREEFKEKVREFLDNNI
ncbi:alpha/beta fold hydrolase [Patescibacteria group bacterium]|nr:alpha/beta fold hydrolase [Patescibacteria group bacterium]MBU1889878.1 alpha/beta fold hydrolase [Patescibacteria group bacterium]